jgi:hypothetical protein
MKAGPPERLCVSHLSVFQPGARLNIASCRLTVRKTAHHERRLEPQLVLSRPFRGLLTDSAATAAPICGASSPLPALPGLGPQQAGKRLHDAMHDGQLLPLLVPYDLVLQVAQGIELCLDRGRIRELCKRGRNRRPSHARTCIGEGWKASPRFRAALVAARRK